MMCVKRTIIVINSLSVGEDAPDKMGYGSQNFNK